MHLTFGYMPDIKTMSSIRQIFPDPFLYLYMSVCDDGVDIQLIDVKLGDGSYQTLFFHMHTTLDFITLKKNNIANCCIKLLPHC